MKEADACTGRCEGGRAPHPEAALPGLTGRTRKPRGRNNALGESPGTGATSPPDRFPTGLLSGPGSGAAWTQCVTWGESLCLCVPCHADTTVRGSASEDPRETGGSL